MANFNTGMTKEQILAALRNGADAATSADLEALSAVLQSEIGAKASIASLTAETEARERTDAALADLIDSSAKNYINTIDLDAIKSINTGGTWNGNVYTRYNIEYTVNTDGTISLRTIGGAATNGGALVIPCRALTGEAYHLSGVPSDASGYDLRVGSGSTYRDTGSGLDFTATGNYSIYVRVDSGTNIEDAVTIYPMLCLKSAHNISQNYVPYAPTNAELYAMILNNA